MPYVLETWCACREVVNMHKFVHACTNWTHTFKTDKMYTFTFGGNKNSRWTDRTFERFTYEYLRSD
jgi:hypothetical protein